MTAEERHGFTPAFSSYPARKVLPPFEALRAFDAIARFGGVRKAAAHLNRDHAVVSRHLRNIERWTGARLLERSPGGALLTEEGLHYHQQIASAIDCIASATAKLMKRGESKRLHVRCTPEFALHWLSPRLAQFERSSSNIDIEVRPTDQTPDNVVSLADVEVRFISADHGTLDLPSVFKSEVIACAPMIAVASRSYLSRVAAIRRPHDLLCHQLLREESYDRWRNWLAAHGVRDDVELVGPRLWHGPLTLDAARHGRGIALTNQLTAAADLREGRLVEVGRGLASFAPLVVGLWHFIARADRWDERSVACFRTLLISAISKEHPLLSPLSRT